ncbi:hypothetical protein LZ31DRAFT_347929 [Colletotrichum somersetense]|nr:hypothetical protein LZ31DRAFT_347929 [Colletotrichum somersetense]
MSSNARLSRRSAARDKNSKVVPGQRTVASFFSSTSSTKIESVSSKSSVPASGPGRIPLADNTNTANLPGSVNTDEVVASSMVVSSSRRVSVLSASSGSEFHAGHISFNTTSPLVLTEPSAAFRRS